VPTTAGSSADVSQFAIVTDSARKVKAAIVSKAVVPDLALIDPQTTTTLPADLTAATGVDALVHAIESYVSNASSPLTDLHAPAAISLVTANLVSAIKHPDQLEYRKNMMLGSLLAGLAFSNASLGLVHAMAHSLGGLLDLPHGICNAVLLACVVDFNYPAAAERYDRIGLAMGLDLDALDPHDRKKALITGLERLREEAGIRTADLKLDLSRQVISQLAAKAFNDVCLVTNPREATVLEIENIYEQAFRKS
jgi:alcohol dehydrogenase class IV